MVSNTRLILHFDITEEVIRLPSEDQYKAAAKVSLESRTPEQQKLVEQGYNLQSVRNADFNANGRATVER